MVFEYIEPDDYFPKDIRKKYKLGEFDPSYRANRNGYFVYKRDIYYIEMDDEGELKNLRGWPNDAEVSDTKKKLAEKAVAAFDDSPKEMIYMLGHSKDEFSFIVVRNDGVYLLENELVEKQMILFPEEVDCYARMYLDEISKYLPEWEQEDSKTFWQKMATAFPGISPDEAIEYIKDHVDEFKVDPIGLGKYKYTKCSTFREDMSYNYNDGIHTYFLSTKGQNVDEVPEKLVKFLDYVGTGKMDETDDLLDHLKRTEVKIKSDREIGERFMVFEEMMQDQFKAGKAEGKAEGVAEATAKLITAYLNNGGTKEEAVKIFEMTVDEIEQVLK